jgi:hypothetical protein
LVENSDD